MALRDRFLGVVEHPAAVCVVLYFVVFGVYYFVQGPLVLSSFGLSIISNNSVSLAVVAAALTFVILTGGFDLSVAGVVALGNSILAVCALHGWLGALEGLAIVVAVGSVVGSVNGLLVAYAGLQSIAVTLATLLVTGGIALLVLHAPGGSVPSSITGPLTGSIGRVPYSALGICVLAVGCWWVLEQTGLGASIYAVGQDRTAAEASGIRVQWTEFLAYTIAGGLAGLGGYVVSAETGTGTPQYSPSFLLLAFAAVAIGGTSFRGGRGSAVGSVVGAALLELIEKTLFAMGVSSFFTGMVEGALMVVAVLVGTVSYGVARMRTEA